MSGSRRAAAIAGSAILFCAPSALAQSPPSTDTPVVTYTQQPKPTTPPPGQQGGARIVPQGFSVILVLADLSTSGAQDDVPPAARRALADMKDFLPYKSYKLLDAAWLLGQGGVQTTRLRGPEEQEYELKLAAHSSGSSRVSVQFSLRDFGTAEEALVAAVRDRAASTEAQMVPKAAQVRQQIARTESELRAARSRKEEARVRELERDLETLRARLRTAQETEAVVDREHAPRKSSGSRSIIDTSFMMDVGETVVVGTSRLRGNSRALIALLTAVPAKGRMPETAR